MTLQININPGASANGGVGIGPMTAAGNPWAVPDQLAYELVNRGLATAYNWAASSQQPLSNSELAAARAVAAGAAGFPIAEAVAAGASASFVELLGQYITTRSNVPTSADQLANMPHATAINTTHVYVDPVNGVDTNSGFSPSAAKKTLTTANWTSGLTSLAAGMTVLLKRGSDFTLTAPLGQGASGFSGSMSLGAYGDPSLPLPILRPQPGAVYQGAGLSWNNPNGAACMDIMLDCTGLDSGSQAYHGIRFFSTNNTDTFQNVVISGCVVRAPRTAQGSWPAGITVHKTTAQNSSSSNVRAGYVRIEGNEVYGGGAHGIEVLGAFGYLLPNGSWGGCEVIGNYVHECGKDYDSHGITAVTDGGYSGINIPWVLVSGTTYYVAWSTLIGRSIGDIDYCNIVVWSRDGCRHHLTKNTATPTAPAIGEFGFDNATQRLYVNSGVALGATDELRTSGQPPRGILYAYNRCTLMPINNRGPYTEGTGLQFDDWTSDSIMFANRSWNNDGAGLAVNHGSNNRVIRNWASGNKLVGIGFLGHGTMVEGNVVIGSSTRPAGTKGLIASDPGNGYIGTKVNQVRYNLLVPTGALDALIMQTDAAGFYGNYTIARGNQGLGVGSLATDCTRGKIIGF